MTSWWGKIVTSRVPGGVLQLTLGVGIVISAICASMIMLVYYSQTILLQQSIDDRLRNNAVSGIQYSMAARNTLPLGVSHTVDLFGEEIDSVDVLRRPWGMFEVILCQARHYRHTVAKAAIITALPDMYGQAAVYAPENNAPVYLVGQASITGIAYLPERKLSTGYIDGKDFEGDKLIHGEVYKSKHEILPLDTTLLHELEELIIGDTNAYHPRHLAELPSAELPFQSESSNYFYSGGTVDVSGTIGGNLILHASEKLRIASDAKLSNVILIARDIDIEEGFHGNVQCFATRTITVGRDCKLDYPSSLVLLNGSDSLILIRQNASVEGYAVIPGTDQSIEGRGTLKLEKQAIFHGMAYVNGAADIQGSLWGHITAKRFVASSGTGRYSNHILDGRISSLKRSPYLPGTLLWAHTKALTVAKWLD